MNKTIYFLVSLVLVTGLVLAINLEGYPDYCTRYNIEEYCSSSAYDQLVEDLATGRINETYINEVAFNEDAIYRGPIEITRIEVNAVVGEEMATIVAKYELKNTGSEEVTVNLMALQAYSPDLRVEEDGAEVSYDEMLSWDSTFSAGQDKRIEVSLSLPMTENIFGYNINLAVDKKVPLGDLPPPTATYVFTLPVSSGIECVPEPTSIVGSTVTWQRDDVVGGWTNPFNDLICAWSTSASTGSVSVSGETAPSLTAQKTGVDSGGTNWLLVGVLLLLAVVVVVIVLQSSQKQKKGKKK